MGISNIFGFKEASSPGGIKDIRREDYQAMLNEAIEHSGLDEVHPSLASNLRAVGRSRQYLAALSWGVRGYDNRGKEAGAVKIECGCPMTEAGVAVLKGGERIIRESDIYHEQNQKKRTAAQKFVDKYDNLVKSRYPNVKTFKLI